LAGVAPRISNSQVARARLWHDDRMVALIKIAVHLLAGAARFSILLFRPTRSVQAENLFLRRQLALFKERGIQPRRIDVATRISLVILTRFFEWRDALFVVRPNTMIRWHRAGWRLIWRWKCRPGRPQPAALRVLIRRMARENPVCDEERIASELLVKLGIQVCPRTMRKYMPKRLVGQPRGGPRWSPDILATVRLESHYRLGEGVAALAKSVLGGLHHQYSKAPSVA
jgi:putative transposase